MERKKEKKWKVIVSFLVQFWKIAFPLISFHFLWSKQTSRVQPLKGMVCRLLMFCMHMKNNINTCTFRLTYHITGWRTSSSWKNWCNCYPPWIVERRKGISTYSKMAGCWGNGQQAIKDIKSGRCCRFNEARDSVKLFLYTNGIFSFRVSHKCKPWLYLFVWVGLHFF